MLHNAGAPSNSKETLATILKAATNFRKNFLAGHFSTVYSWSMAIGYIIYKHSKTLETKHTFELSIINLCICISALKTLCKYIKFQTYFYATNFVTLDNMALHCITSHYIALHRITLHHIALHSITSHYIALNCIT